MFEIFYKNYSRLNVFLTPLQIYSCHWPIYVVFTIQECEKNVKFDTCQQDSGLKIQYLQVQWYVKSENMI